jgi:hypothetical protein
VLFIVQNAQGERYFYVRLSGTAGEKERDITGHDRDKK